MLGFCYFNKIPELINFKKEKAYFGSVWEIAVHGQWAFSFEPEGGLYIMVGMNAGEVSHLTVAGNQKKEKEEEIRVPESPLKACSQ